MGNGLKVLRLKKYLVIIFFIVAALIFIGHGFYTDYQAKKRFYKSMFSGEITGIKKGSRGMIYVKLNDEYWQYLGIYYNSSLTELDSGDSITKSENDFNIYLYKTGKRINIAHDRFKEKTFE
jgi:hypothetical protein